MNVFEKPLVSSTPTPNLSQLGVPPIPKNFEPKNNIRKELLKILTCAGMVAYFLALVSYSKEDSSLSTWSNQTHIKNYLGKLGSLLADLSFQGLGWAGYGLITVVLLYTFFPLKEEKRLKRILNHVNSVAFLLSLSLLCAMMASKPQGVHPAGGALGLWMKQISVPLIGRFGSGMFSLVVAVCTFTYLTKIPWMSLAYQKLRERLKRKPKTTLEGLDFELKKPVEATEEEEDRFEPIADFSADEPKEPVADGEQLKFDPEVEAPEGPLAKPKRSLFARKPKKTNMSYALPSIKLLAAKANAKAKTVDKSWYLERGEILVQKLKDFGVEGEIVHIAPGPVITVYEFKPASGVKIREIANLSDDLTLALSALSVRIVAPIPGKPVVGIEIPSPNRETVFFKDLVQEPAFSSPEQRIPIVLGSTASGGQTVIVDLAAMPHLLIAGATGTGKSVFINTLICSLLYRFTPQNLKLILVDPKMVELSQFDHIPHLLLPVVVDSKKAAMALRWLIDEMERRYTAMHQMGVRHVDSFNERLSEMKANGEGQDTEYLPYIVTVIDEYADLMAVVPKDVELSITRLAQKARASGIHLVLATQRPSTDVVTGTIKANFPCRISFRVSSSVDSKTILDRTGAERLLGNGDLLFLSPGFNSLKRVQGPFLNDKDTNQVVEFLRAQGEPQYDENILNPPEGECRTPEEAEADEKSAKLYDQAVALVAEKGEASISLIQRHLRIGYNRAATLMEQMEKEGVVAESSGNSKRRAVLIQSR